MPTVMKTVGAAILVLTLVGCSEALMGANPWVDNSMCLPTDPPATCSMKKMACAPVNQILSPPTATGGLVSSITTCANASGAALDLSFFLTIGMAYGKGSPESLLDKVTTDPSVAKTIRTCVANSTGMLGSDLKLNRSSILTSLASQPFGAEVALPIAQAVMTCPEPVDLLISPFMTCLRKACMDNVSVLPTAPKPAAAKPTAPKPVAYPQPAALYNPLAAATGAVGAVPAALPSASNPAPAVVPASSIPGFGSAQTLTPELANLLQSLAPK